MIWAVNDSNGDSLLIDVILYVYLIYHKACDKREAFLLRSICERVEWMRNIANFEALTKKEYKEIVRE